MSTHPLHSQKDIEEIKKESEKAFDNEEYTISYKLYSQLVANFPKEALYNYRLGVSMIYAEPDKKKCINYLEYSIKFIQKKETPLEALFYLGKAYHINYRFDDALKYYREYKQQVSSSKSKEMQADKEIAACENGKKLLSNIKELVILSKKRLHETEYFRSYDLSTIGGKLLVKPDEFQTKYDKKRKDKSVIYLPQQGNKVFFSSYGEDGKNGRDIYFAIRLPNGKFAKPQLLKEVNTAYDEDYPFLHPNGKILYFASKGHKGMGGYDIFKSTYDEASQSWSMPENLEFPINSPGDDFLFVTDSSEKIAFFSTSRYSPPAQIDVLKIKVERVPPLLVAIKGNVRKTEINQSIRSAIAVKNIETGDLVGTFAANENGEYYMELPNSGKFLFTVETPGFTKQSESVNLPISYAIKPLRQSISYEKNVLVITNYFGESNTENGYLDIVEFIEKKAQLDANEDQFKSQDAKPLLADNNNNNDTLASNVQINKSQGISASNTQIPPSNTKDLIDIVKKDVEETQSEVNQLETQKNQLNQVVQMKEQEIKSIEKNTEDTQNELKVADSKEEKEQLSQLLNDLQQKKKTAEEQKQFYEQYQKEIQTTLDSKKKESDVNQQFLTALQEFDTGKNKNTSLKKLEQLQKELQTIEKEKTDKTDMLASLDTQEKEKQDNLSKLDAQKTSINKDVQLIEQEINNLKNELANTKDKTLKDNIQTQISEKESGLREQQKILSEISEKVNDTKEDIQSIQEQKQLITKIKNNESIPTNTNNETGQKNNLITNSNINQVNEEYQIKILNAKTNEEKLYAIDGYNKILMKSIEENKKKISNSNDLSEKQKLQNLNSELEQILKSNNDQFIALKNNNQANNITQEDNPPHNFSNSLPINISNQQEVLSSISKNEQLKSDFMAIKKQFETQNYQTASSNQFKQNIPTITDNPADPSKNIVNIIHANSQINYLNQQADSLRKISNELKTKTSKTTNNNEKQKLLADAKKTDIAALEKEYQSTQFTKTLNQNLLKLYETKLDQLDETQKKSIVNELNQSKQNFQQAEQIRKESNTQSNLTIKIATEQNAQEKEQIALNILSKAFKEKNILLPTENIQPSIQNENTQIEQKHTEVQKQYINANKNEINYLLSIADTSKKIKNDPNYSQSLNDLNNIQKNIENQYNNISANNNKQEYTNIINNQLQLIQQLRQITSITQPYIAQNNNYIIQEEKNKIIASNISKDSALSYAQKIPLNINNNSTQYIQSLIQEQQQIEDNLKTENPIINPSEEVLKGNEKFNTEIAQLTNKALQLKQQIDQTNNQRKKSELQIEFERTNGLIQEKKLNQITSEILVNQSEYTAQQNLINQLINSIPSNHSTEKNNAINTFNEIQKFKKQEEQLIKEALTLANPSAQLGALQNARIKQQEYLQAQQELINQTSKYNPQVKKQPTAVNINDPLALAIKYQNNIYKQTKEWESINNNLNLEITRLYPKYSTTPSGQLLAEAQKLLSEAKKTNNSNKKLELNIKAAQLQQQAMQQLSASLPSIATNTTNTQVIANNVNNQQAKNNNTQVAANNTNNQQVKNNNTQVIANNTNNQQAKNNNTQVIANNTNNQQAKNASAEISNSFLPQIKSIKISKTASYSDARPIPLNPALPNGLIFSVQVGAFKNPLPNNFFNGINPIYAQTTENNLYRYLVGQMTDAQEAIALKNNFKNLGYTDAFVIAYYNGKRISLSEALEILRKQMQKEPPINPFATTNVLEKANIPTYTTLLATTQNNATPATIKESEEINDLYFTIQIGVYGKNVSSATFKYIQPIIRGSVNNKFYRYSAGIYNNLSQTQNDLNKVIQLGIKDAFICAYWNGKRIFYPEAEKLIRENKNIRYASPQPIVFPNETVSLNPKPNFTAQNAIIENNPNVPDFDPRLVFTTDVTKRPEPTPENGVKADNSGICFRVQIGAFKNKIPKAVADKFFKIKDWPIEVHYTNGLYIYTIGNFISAKYATKLRTESISLGITDAFLTVYKDNKKLFGYEAMQYLNQ